jgi:hypothetical protein
MKDDGGGCIVVASCSTLPGRARNGKLERAVQSILAQNNPAVHTVFLNYPTGGNARLGGELYPPVPLALARHPRVTVVPCVDKGPLTKIYPAIDAIERAGLNNSGAAVAVLVFDDDTEYPAGWLARLYRAYTGRAGVGYSGRAAVTNLRFRPFAYDFNTRNSTPVRVAYLGGHWTALYPLRVFPSTSAAFVDYLAAQPRVAYTNDDIVIGTLAHAAGVPLLVIPVARGVIADAMAHRRKFDVKFDVDVDADVRPVARRHADESYSLWRSPGQQFKMFSLAPTYICQGMLPVSWPPLLLMITGLLFTALLVVLPLAVVAVRKRPPPPLSFSPP